MMLIFFVELSNQSHLHSAEICDIVHDNNNTSMMINDHIIEGG